MRLLREPITNSVAYGLAATGWIVGETSGMDTLVYVCKPLLMIILSSWFYFSSRRYGDRFTLLVQAGLFFSLVGDVALMYQQLDEFFFLIGLGAFLIAQICYAMAFAYNALEVGDMDGLGVSLGLSLGIVIFGIFFFWGILPKLDELMTIPVAAYAVAICLMGIAAAFRYRRTFPTSFWTVFFGSLLFIASDSLLAADRFQKPLDNAPLLIGITYVLAQYLIVAGCLLHVLDPEEIRRRQALTT
jgi:uncharacterized membrane protein YhhN